jgi:hypothetical protein
LLKSQPCLQINHIQISLNLKTGWNADLRIIGTIWMDSISFELIRITWIRLELNLIGTGLIGINLIGIGLIRIA